MPQDKDSCSVEEQHLPDETLNQGLHAVIKHSLHSSREKGFQRWCPVQSLTQVQPVPNLALVPASPPNHPLSLIGSFLISPAGEPVFGERCSPYWQLCITMVATHTKSFRYLKGAVLFKMICDISRLNWMLIKYTVLMIKQVVAKRGTYCEKLCSRCISILSGSGLYWVLGIFI